MRKSLKVSLLCISFLSSAFALASAAQAYTTAGTAFPGFGNDPNGPGYLITIGLGGGLTITATGQPTNYDGSDDSYVGIVNNSGSVVNKITLTDNAAFNNDIFGFDGDGINTYGAAGNAKDTTGYGGPDAFFTNINASFSSGDVNFIGGLNSGKQTYFSLEEDIGSAVGSGSLGGGVSTVPLPASAPMFGVALLMLVGFGYGMNRWVAPKSKKVAAAA